MSWTAQDIINAALRSIGALSQTESLAANNSNNALQALNFMIDTWSAQKLMGTATVRENFPLTANKSTYTIGMNGDFNTATPFAITYAFYRDSANVDTPLEIISREEFQSFGDKAIVSAPPLSLFFDPGVTQQANQVGTINLYYTPDASSSYTLYIDSQKPFTEFANLSTAVTFPPSYYKALKYGLAIELAPEYGKALTNDIKELFTEAIETLESVNSKRVISVLDIPGRKGGGFNWISGEAS